MEAHCHASAGSSVAAARLPEATASAIAARTAATGASADGGGGGGSAAAADGGGEGGDELRAGLALLGLPATDLGASPPPVVASAAAAAAASPRAAPRPTRKLAWVLTAVQLGLIGWVAALLCERYPSGRRMLRALRYSVSRSSRGGMLT